jgi:hypothetical protein
METFTDKLEAYFRARPGVWVNGMALAKVAGQYAWRSRCADVRRRGLDIQNRQRRVLKADGKRYTVSEYRFVPAVPQTSAGQAELFV